MQEKRYLFWILQFAGWSGWGVSFYLGVLVWGKAPDNYNFYLPVISVIGMIITLGLRALYKYMWDMDVGRRIVAILAASYAAGLGWMSIRATIFYEFFESERKPHELETMELFSYFDGAMSAFWIMLLWSGLYFGIKYYMLLQEEKQRGLKVASMAHEAQLKMLRYQPLQPAN